MPPEPSGSPFSVALVGGGITGITLTVALLKRGIDVKIYEQAPQFTEIGAGIAFSPNAKQAMQKCDPAIYDAYQKIATRSRAAEKAYTWYDWMDGYDQVKGEHPRRLFTIDRDSSADGCHRAHFLEELLKLIPEGVAHFNKHLETIIDSQDNSPLTLKFHDGTSSTADVVIGCDGIKSCVRRLLFGEDAPQSYPSYTHVYAYRGLVEMDKAIDAIGEDIATSRTMYMGQDGHVLTFPVAHGKIMNVVAFRHDPQVWKSERLVVPTTRDKAKEDFKDWGQNVNSIINMLRGDLDKWAIFDLGDNPLPYFSKGRICVAGDAAHATGPHHGAGAGFCIEDSAVLAELLHVVWVNLQSTKGGKPKAEILEDVLKVFDDTRRERTQWLVESSRVSADLYEWRDKTCGKDPAKIKEELLWRNHKIWDVNIDEITNVANEKLRKLLV
ncbi:hypothetical protein F5884DRAFT_445969 [Xylogone sp. PMI_703]|nr:hypothetical protein F5884DRAFT_445969 [Xylogone sp. PMI_703]